MPEISTKMPAILFTHLSPTKSSLFLKSIVAELRIRNQRHEPIKSPAIRIEAEKKLSSLSKPRAANTAIKAKMVKGFVSVKTTVVRYNFNIPPFFI